MSDDLARIEELAGALLRRVSAGERRRLLRIVARDICGSQSARVARQQNPGGTAFAARRAKALEAQLASYPVRFLYPKGAAEPRLVLMKSWARQGPLLTGYDIEAGGIRSFFWDQVDKWLPLEPADQARSAGRLRRRGKIRNQVMFRKLRGGRFLRADASENEAWIGFSGRAAEIARIHQEGLQDRPSAKGKPVRYAKRELLGLSDGERARMLDILLRHI